MESTESPLKYVCLISRYVFLTKEMHSHYQNGISAAPPILLWALPPPQLLHIGSTEQNVRGPHLD